MSTELTEAEREALHLADKIAEGMRPGIQALIDRALAQQREEIAQAIEALHPLDDCPSCNYGHGLRDAARIARGDA